MDVCLVQCLCCQVEVSAAGRSLVQRSPTDCDVCVCDRVKINNLDTCCEQVGRRGKDCENKRTLLITVAGTPSIICRFQLCLDGFWVYFCYKRHNGLGFFKNVRCHFVHQTRNTLGFNQGLGHRLGPWYGLSESSGDRRLAEVFLGFSSVPILQFPVVTAASFQIVSFHVSPNTSTPYRRNHCQCL
jgi:hypothetical protein